MEEDKKTNALFVFFLGILFGTLGTFLIAHEPTRKKIVHHAKKTRETLRKRANKIQKEAKAAKKTIHEGDGE